MSNLAGFRKDVCLQHEYALQTGCTVNKLLKDSKALHGKTNFETFLQREKTINWLDEDQCLNASIHGLKQTAQKISNLEEWLGLSYPEILSGLENKHYYTCLAQLFVGELNEEWGNVHKCQIKPLLEEFHWWCEYLNALDICEHDFDSAQDLLFFLDQPLFKQLKQLVDIVVLNPNNFDYDVDVFKNIMKSLRDDNKSFIQEWLSSAFYNHYNVISHKEYKSLYSWFFLSTVAQVYGYKSNQWATKRQWATLGCELKQSAKPAAVFHFYKNKHENAFEHVIEQHTEKSFGRKISIVYNADEVIGFEGESFANTKVKALPVLEKRIDELGIHIKHNNDEAAYNSVDDFIMMPHKELFKEKDSTKAYYSTLLHEMVHWTGHETRCNRTFGKVNNGSSYAFEELVAEIGSAFLCARFGLTKKVRTSSIQYIAHWLNEFDDNECIKTLEKAASLANHASNFIYVPKRKRDN